LLGEITVQMGELDGILRVGAARRRGHGNVLDCQPGPTRDPGIGVLVVIAII
jgi:hypothetical protein